MLVRSITNIFCTHTTEKPFKMKKGDVGMAKRFSKKYGNKG